MSKIGYARVSTRDQNLARQIEQLHDAGVNKIFQEKLSGKNADRPQLKAMLDYIRDDDEVVVLSLDRLGRNSHDLTDIIETIRHRGAQLNVLNLPSFASIEDPNLRNLITTIIVELYKYIAQEERETIKIRQQQGIEIAKRQGKYKGKIREYGPSFRRFQAQQLATILGAKPVNGIDKNVDILVVGIISKPYDQLLTMDVS
ncbi:putative invertase [Lacticaseibacillus paracasei]|nr:putative invertase [Lacticaseibacillus paracasei]